MVSVLKSSMLHNLKSSPHSDCEVLFIMPCVDLPMAKRAAHLMQARAGAVNLQLVIVQDDSQLGFIQIVNSLFSVTTSNYFGYCAQDAFAGRLWLEAAVMTLQQGHKGLLGFNDGKWHGALASFGLARRAWVQNIYPGRFFFDGYESHYADTELTLIARGQNQYVYNPNAVLVELDWDKDSKGNNPRDKTLFAKRKELCFDGMLKNAELLGLFK